MNTPCVKSLSVSRGSSDLTKRGGPQLHRTGNVSAADLPDTPRDRAAPAPAPSGAGRPPGALPFALPEEGLPLEELERTVLLAALEKHDWNRSRAARYLGLTCNTLLYRMQKFGLKKP